MRLAVGPYDRSKPLVIDPVVHYSTLVGGSDWDASVYLDVDGAGNAYVVGWVYSTDYPTVNSYQGKVPGGSLDVVVTKLNPTGTALVYSTYLGGTANDYGVDIAVDSAGSAYVTGETGGGGFPKTAGSYTDVNHTGGGAFVAKLSPAGNDLAYSTYLGGVGGAHAEGIAVDANGSAYITGWTNLDDFPTTPGVYKPATPLFSNNDAFVTKLNPAGSGLAYSTLLGGPGEESGYALTVDGSGNAYATGYTQYGSFPTTLNAYDDTYNGDRDVFVTKLNAAGSALQYSTYLGGSGGEIGFGIAVDSSGKIYVSGQTSSSNFPVTAGAYQTAAKGLDAFVTKFDPGEYDAASLLYSTRLGGTDTESAGRIAVDSAGNAYVTGNTSSTDFPLALPVQAFYGGGAWDAFVTKLNPTGSDLVYSTYWGSSDISGDIGLGIILDGTGNAYVSGDTDAPGMNFPTTDSAYRRTNAGDRDIFLLRINAADQATASAGGSVTVSTAPGVAGQAGVTATLTDGGDGGTKVTVENFSSNPANQNVFDVGGGFVDLNVSSASSNDKVIAYFYYSSQITGAEEVSLQLLYETTTGFAPVLSSGGTAPLKETTNNLDGTVSGGRFCVTFDNTSTPKITELTGTVFAHALTPLGAIRVLIARVAGLSLTAGQKNSLTSKLNAAHDSLVRGDRSAAIGQLRAFINEVQDLKQQGLLGAATADALIAFTNRILGLI